MEQVIQASNAQNPVLDSQKRSSSWYKDRYETIKMQRNIFGLLSIVFAAGIAIAVFTVGQISSSKSFSPFVVQIEQNSGYAKVVNPADSKLLSADDSIGKYFLTKYVNARESYNTVDFDLNRKIVRLFSNSQVYNEYSGYIRNPLNDPTKLYKDKNSTYVKIKSITRLGDKFFVRFDVCETANTVNIKSKIATVTFEYIAMQLTDDERGINPVGFQISGYGVSDDKS
ncbi:MAG: type IV secretion system protein [Rickettsiaceae bacterium]|nr:type IV secretion system protein [Rickettsiaceae bacterium]